MFANQPTTKGGIMWRVTAMATDKHGYFSETGKVYTFATLSQARRYMRDAVRVGNGYTCYRALKCGGVPIQCKVDGTKEHYYSTNGYWTE